MAESSDIVSALSKLKNLREGVHWFCPRKASNDPELFFDEDLVYTQTLDKAAKDRKARKVEEAKARHELVIQALQIFAFDGKDAEIPQKWMEERQTEQMQQCDICIREFHRGRNDLKQKLESIYYRGNVLQFLVKFDGMNLRRIENGLLSATEQLSKLPAKDRGIAALDQHAVFALFEAFNCAPFYMDETKLSHYFDEFFHLVQTNKLVKLSSYSPAMFVFLFGSNRDRVFWATKTLKKLKRNLTSQEFEHCAKEPLQDAMSRVQLFSLEKEFLQQFWEGTNLIVRRLDGNQIANQLCSLEIAAVEEEATENNICRLALSHLQVDDDAFNGLLSTIEYILQISPKDFWEALGAIPTSTWIAQFFRSPALARLLNLSQSPNSDPDPLLLDQLFHWIMPFLNSVALASQIPTCRSLVGHLLGRMQEGTPSIVKAHTLKTGLQVLAISLENINRDFWSVLLPTSREALETVSQHLTLISAAAQNDSDATEYAAEVFKQAISLDCKCLVLFSKPPSTIRDPKDEFVQYLSLWHSASRVLSSSSTVLAKSLLSAVKPVFGIEPFLTKDQLSDEQKQFNGGLAKIHTLLSEWLDRISEFTVNDLQKLFDDSDTVNSMMGILFSPNERVQTSCIEIMKSLSGKSSRSDAMGYLLRHHPVLMLNSIYRSLRGLEVAKTFTSASSALTPCSHVIDILCNQTNGLLRSQTLSSAEAISIENFWQALWLFLTMIFSSTEGWSNIGYDIKTMIEFCRKTMNFADNTFEQFGVFRGALDSSESDEGAKLGKRLIEKPKAATTVIIKWLKLRDEVLVARSCALVCKLLTRLKEFQVQLDETSLQYVMEIAMDVQKNNLLQRQKAELLRALETHSGMTVDSQGQTSISASGKEAKQRQVIDLDEWASKADKTSSSATKTTATGKPAALSRAPPSVTPTYDRLQTSGFPPRPGPHTTQPGPDPAVVLEFQRKRERELAEKKQRDALALAQRRKQFERPIGSATAGSALKTLGVAGKEHVTPNKAKSMMVSSDDSDSDDDDDDDDEELNEMDEALFGRKKPNAKGKELTAEQAKAMKQQRGPVKKQRLVRSARDMRARLTPDLIPLHKIILGWEYFHDGGFPPGTSEEYYSAVQNTFRDVHGYQRKFQPLLLLEAWNSFLKAREENASKTYEFKVMMRSNVDGFFEVNSTMSLEDGKDVSEGDIVLLSKIRSASLSEPHALARVDRVSKKKTHLEVIYRTMPNSSLGPHIGWHVMLYGLKITSIIPLEREYGALLGLQYYDLCEEITRARPSPLLNYSDDRLVPIMKNYGINKAQAKAVKCAIDNDAFTLVQGPPGSGKTKTIVAIVGALLSNSLKAGPTTISQPKVQGQPNTNQAPKKLMVCAPSNAAVDELVMRFKAGVITLGGDHKPVNVVRIGRSDAINAEVVDVTLDELVKKRLNVGSNEANARAETQKIMEEHRVLSEKFREARAKLDEAEANGRVYKHIEEDFQTLRRQKALLGQKVDAAKDNEAAQNRQAEVNKKKAQQDVLDSANVICATLSGSGHDMFLNLNIEFETVIIDEAAQCVELSALIPLKYGCAKCVLVGDPQQLPPTIFSKDAARFKYEQSLFVRMQGNHPDDVHLLDTQYRMHPEISSFPSKTFYDGRLLDGKDMALTRTRPWHSTTLLSPFRFFDVQGQHQSAPKGHSLINVAEVEVSIQLYKRLTRDFPDSQGNGKIGIITPYKSQLRELKDSFKRKFGSSIFDKVEFNTTDAFQGRESDVIIFSCVRASPEGGIGFLQDVRRMNVGLTRAKSSLWVLGNSQSLKRGEFWGKLIEHAKSRQLYTTGNIQALLSNPLEISTSGFQPYHAMDIDVKEDRPKVVASQELSETSKKRRRSEDAEDMGPSSNKKLAMSSTPQDSDVEMVDTPPIPATESSASLKSEANTPSSDSPNDYASPLPATEQVGPLPKPTARPPARPPVRKPPEIFIKRKNRPRP